MIRNEYPRPQFVRNEWMNLNGEWAFEFDDNRVGEQAGWGAGNHPFTQQIQVPFCYESKLSGIEDKGVHDVVWYQRSLRLPDDWKGRQVVLHFGAVDYAASVWINGQFITKHEGGHTSFSVNITNSLHAGENVLVVRAEDYARDLSLPRGKQYWKDKSEAIFYTRTTGIWQTVWLEAVSVLHLDHVKMTPDIDQNTVQLRTFVNGLESCMGSDVKLRIRVSFKGEELVEQVIRIHSNIDNCTVQLPDFDYHFSRPDRWWTPEHPHLYDVHFELSQNGQIVDQVTSYFGMRKISVEKGKLCLNNHPYFMRLVLDQGYFPEGLLTAPSDEAIRQDVELTKSMGFNGARKHQKIEDPRYLYWCDRLGLLVWGEAANACALNETYIRRLTQEWQEAIERDYNHPSIVAWVPLNESWGVPNILTDAREQHHANAMYYLTKSLDPHRLVISNDGWEHMTSDLLTIHDYEWREHVLIERYRTVDNAIQSRPAERQLHVGKTLYQGEPILVSEFGGIAYKKSEWEGWGYSGADNDQDFLQRLAAVVDPLIASPVVQGFCYTQLTDVEQEINGLLTYNREPKVPLEDIRKIIGALKEEG
ncbi:glycoside hydrolase family 2 protein [Paenibacillus rigui]